MVLELGGGGLGAWCTLERADTVLFSLFLLWEDNSNYLEHRVSSFTVSKPGSCFISWGEMCFLGKDKIEGSSVRGGEYEERNPVV